MLKQRDIVLVPIPFTDLSSKERRPVVIISNNEYNERTEDIVVVAMTSNLQQQSEYSFVVTNDDVEAGHLLKPSCIRVDKIYTLSKSIVVKTFGKINQTTFEKILVLLKRLTGE